MIKFLLDQSFYYLFLGRMLMWVKKENRRNVYKYMDVKRGH